jgi:hypothetical protein
MALEEFGDPARFGKALNAEVESAVLPARQHWIRTKHTKGTKRPCGEAAMTFTRRRNEGRWAPISCCPLVGLVCFVRTGKLVPLGCAVMSKWRIAVPAARLQWVRTKITKLTKEPWRRSRNGFSPEHEGRRSAPISLGSFVTFVIFVRTNPAFEAARHGRKGVKWVPGTNSRCPGGEARDATTSDRRPAQAWILNAGGGGLQRAGNFL